ncbi:hypothetical protein COB52_05010 [Candidatus Kaiserbacteria bacterium]|nr:MAG: hypothetical protein COB52_05010 [Candidatus Kaiserbacteria bacterium]
MALVLLEYARREPENTLLYKIFQKEWPSFLAGMGSGAQMYEVPGFVKKEVDDYFKCGLLQYGFVRFHCKDCKRRQLVAFPCKRRSFCPSCCDKRMNQTAAHLTDSVFPDVGTRQWVIFFPFF